MRHSDERMRGIGKVILYGSGRESESENFREWIIITASAPRRTSAGTLRQRA